MSTSSLTITEFLQKYPWSPEEKAQHPIDYLWHFDLSVRKEALWPALADTSMFNRLLGLPPMQFEEQGDKLFGRTSYGLFQMEWREVEWEWEYGRVFRNAREFSHGFAHYLRGIYLFEERGREDLRLYVYFGWLPKGWWNRWVVKISMKVLRRKYDEGIPKVVQFAKTPKEFPKLVETSNPWVIPQDKFSEIGQALQGSHLNPELVQRVLDFVKSASDDELDRIRVRPLARAWEVAERELLSVFLNATRQGLFLLTWDVICPHCRGSREDVKHLGEIPKEVYCPICEIDFDPTDLNGLEVTFHVHPVIRKVEKQLYCSAEVSGKPHIKLKTLVPAQQSDSVVTQVPPGRYRMRIKGWKKYDWLEVTNGLPSGSFVWKEVPQNHNFVTGPNPKLELINASSEDHVFVLEEYESDKDALRPVDLFNFQEFRDLFSEEAVASGMKLDIGNQTILFTDIVGSTKFYALKGDADAFAIVQKHFVTIYDLIRSNEGAVVKTIGDAVMASFTNPMQGLETAIQLQHHFSASNPAANFRLRASLHEGSCLAVQFNNNIDYFGMTVNIAAKLQGLSEAGQVVFSDTIKIHKAVEEFLAANNYNLEMLSYRPPSEAEDLKVYRMSIV